MSALRDPELERLYREHARELPRSSVDELILATARREAHSRPRPVGAPTQPRWKAWRWPVAAAAVIVLSVGLVQVFPPQELQKTTRSEAPASSSAPLIAQGPTPASPVLPRPSPPAADKAVSPSAAARGEAERHTDRQSNEFRRDDPRSEPRGREVERAPSQPPPPPMLAASKDGRRAEPVRERRESLSEESIAMAEGRQPVPFPAVKPQAPRQQELTENQNALRRAAPLPAEPLSEPLPAEESGIDEKTDHAQLAEKSLDSVNDDEYKKKEAARDVAEGDASFAASSSPVGGARTSTAGRVPAPGAPENGTLRNPPDWIRFIRELRRDGRKAEADRELATFRRAYPNYPLPPDLR